MEMEMEMGTGIVMVQSGNLSGWLQWVLWWDDPLPGRRVRHCWPCTRHPGTCGAASTRHGRSHKLSFGCMQGLHGMENINCGFLVHFLVI